MNIYTKNGLRGRRIRRVVNKECVPYFQRDGEPCLAFHCDGADGITYFITLNGDDIKRIQQKREQYSGPEYDWNN